MKCGYRRNHVKISFIFYSRRKLETKLQNLFFLSKADLDDTLIYIRLAELRGRLCMYVFHLYDCFEKYSRLCFIVHKHREIPEYLIFGLRRKIYHGLRKWAFHQVFYENLLVNNNLFNLRLPSPTPK